MKVQLKSLVASDVVADAGWFRDRVVELQDAGVDQLVLRAPADDPERAVAAIEAFGESVIRRTVEAPVFGAEPSAGRNQLP